MNYIHNLSEHRMDSIMVSAGVPADNRVVTVHDINPVTDMPVVVNARFKQGQWYDIVSGDNISEGLTDKAIWCEATYFTQGCVANWDNINNCPI